VTDLHITEGKPPVVVALSDAVGTALRASGVVTANRVAADQWEIAADTRVGVAQVAGLTIWVGPKVPVSRILFLLGYAKKQEWDRNTVGFRAAGDLVPALAGAFADQVERALERGVLQGYSEVEDAMPVLRGRLREQDQLRQRYGLALPLLVRFDEHTVDIPENQLIRSAAESLLRLPALDARVRNRLRGIRQTLIDVTVHRRGLPLPRWQPSRLNARYHVAVPLAELILQGNSLDHAPGAVRANGFMVNMAKVFEDFVTVALAEELRARGGWCRTQDRQHLDVAQQIVIRPDLVWYDAGAPVAVVDAKYKAEKPAGFPDADLYQMLAYCTSLDLPHGHLVYAKGNAEEVAHTVRNAGIQIHAHTLDLALKPRELLSRVARLAERISASRTTYG
jgi:5-methylcytosine-specific restriction enzyme subunit McrC